MSPWLLTIASEYNIEERGQKHKNFVILTHRMNPFPQKTKLLFVFLKSKNLNNRILFNLIT